VYRKAKEKEPKYIIQLAVRKPNTSLYMKPTKSHCAVLLLLLFTLYIEDPCVLGYDAMSVGIYRHFRGACFLHFQDPNVLRRVSCLFPESSFHSPHVLTSASNVFS